MKSVAHLAGFSFALLVTGLGLGCASSTPSASYRQPAQDFEVVESSTDRPLTDTEKAEVRASVASYLDREGVTDSGDYFLKVYLTPENVDAESEWVVVRFTRYTAQRVAVVSSYSYDNLMYSSYYPYYAYDVYPYGYGSVARISFQYYVDPYYGHRRYYYPRRGHGGHKGDRHDTAHNNHGGKPPHVGENSGPQKKPGPHPAPPGSRYTGNLTGKPIDAEVPRRPNRYADRNNPIQNPNPNPTTVTPVVQQDSDRPAGTEVRRENARNHWRGRPGPGTGSSGVAQANYTASPDKSDRVNSANSRPRTDRPASSPTASPRDPVTRPQPQWRNTRTNPRPAPAGVGNPPRATATVSPTGNPATPTVSRPAPAHRQTPTATRSTPNYPRPTPSVPQTRAPAPSHQQPARVAPSAASRGDRGESRPNGNVQREAMR